MALKMKFVLTENDSRKGWDNGSVPEEYSIRGFSGATLSLAERNATEDLLLKHLGFVKMDETANRLRYKSGEGNPGTYLDLLIYPDAFTGRMGVGAVHHIAFRADNDTEQAELRNKLLAGGISVTPVINRNYFRSVYFREPGNVLFEIATDPPGFTVDESLENLGSELKLPEWYENIRQNIERKLPPLKLPVLNK